MIDIRRTCDGRILQIKFQDEIGDIHRILYSDKEIEDSKDFIQKESQSNNKSVVILLNSYRAMPKISIKTENNRPLYILSYFQIEIEPMAVPYIIHFLSSKGITESSIMNMKLFINSKNKIFKIKFE